MGAGEPKTLAMPKIKLKLTLAGRSAIERVENPALLASGVRP